MGLNEVDDYFHRDTELQNYTKTGVKRIINPFIFQNNFQFSPRAAFLHLKEKTCIQDIFEDVPNVTVRRKIIKRDKSVYFCFI